MTLGTPPRPAQARTWRVLGQRIAAIAPHSVGRGLIGLGVLGIGVWLAAASWPALAPYAVGGIIGYATLPLVNSLDRVMPRTLASIAALAAVLALLVAFLALVIPPLAAGIGHLAELIPAPGEVTGGLGELEGWLVTLPEPLAGIALSVLSGVLAGLQQALQGLIGSVTQFIIDQVLGLLGTINFVLGLFILPVWMTSLMTQERIARRQAFTFLPAGARTDALAVARILDRSAASFLRSRMLLAVLTGTFVYGGLSALDALGTGIEPRGTVAIAVLLGVLQLIPELGFIVGFLPVALVVAVLGPAPGATLAAVYVGSEMLAARIADTRIKGGTAQLPAVILIPAIVAMSQFGLIWLFIGAPLLGMVIDLARYAYGRLGDPPAPAGVIPGEITPVTASTPAAPVPIVYRDRVATEGLTSA